MIRSSTIHHLKQNHSEPLKKEEIKKNKVRKYFLEQKNKYFGAPRVPLVSLRLLLPHTTFLFFEDLLWQPSGNKEHPWFWQMAGVLHRAP
jgi:hypothetical protein